MGRPKAGEPSARERILDAAFRLFYRHGVRGVGIDRVIAESGVAKATLYKHFASKDDLVLAYLDQVDQQWFDALHAAARSAGEAPRDQLLGMFDAVVDACSVEGFHGCAFINTAIESVPGSVVHTRAVEHKDQVRGWATDLAKRAGAADAEELARQLMVLMNGVLAGGGLDGDVRDSYVAKSAAEALIAGALPAR
ncbi:TetR/AcrR family transcriptional regulator [Natronoglycomyces albus]|uniref:TetR/AcrR family transcriptional regulator n=1 Tax=Natronoglycomyces albus TaxID=2811108 RepID=A0A895XXK5_9ACTN|nr:TetR/AcrR family transcriptional regulator [Natronoglycomyces albus]QSB06358.1 TetR/AcrR family transcriptional regulator [Natronoglycomyces albus]